MIAIVSDSHVPNRAPEIHPEIVRRIEDAEKIVHAGDFVSEDTFEKIDSLGDLVAVRGNCDFFELPNSETFEVEGITFGVYHGTGINPRGDHDTLVDIAENKLEVDVLIHGHTHQREAVEVNGTILLNPGSCTGVGGGRSRRGDPTMLEVEVEDGKLEVSLLSFGDELEKEEKVFEV